MLFIIRDIVTSKGLLLKSRSWRIETEDTEIFTETCRAKFSRLALYHRCWSVEVEVAAPR